jgi:site-specific DNA-methyltransferase (adenine-specific)
VGAPVAAITGPMAECDPYYRDESVTLFHGDALEIVPTLSGIGAVITDPPYSSGGAFRADRTMATVEKYVKSGTLAYRPEFAGDSRDQRSFLAWAMLWLNAARAASDPGAVLCCFTDWRQLPVMTDAVQAGGWTWRNLATWWKPGIRMQSGRFSSSAEYIVYATNGPEDGAGVGSPQNVYRSGIAPDKVHIAEKPVGVMRWILSVVPRGAVVLDPFAGCGSTLAAAKSLGLRSVGIEIDERYCQVAAERCRQDVLRLWPDGSPVWSINHA